MQRSGAQQDAVSLLFDRRQRALLSENCGQVPFRRDIWSLLYYTDSDGQAKTMKFLSGDEANSW